jgi:DNA-binding MarR family transcriptional regulator
MDQPCEAQRCKSTYMSNSGMSNAGPESPDPSAGAAVPARLDGSWTEAESEAAFRVLGDQIVDATRRYMRSVRRRRMQAELYTVDGLELTLAQVDALEAVATGEVRMHELAARLGIDPSTATRSIAPLVDLALVDRSVDPANRRFVVLRCTERGLTVARTLIERRRALMRQVLTPMAPWRRLQFAELLNEYLYLEEVELSRALGELRD